MPVIALQGLRGGAGTTSVTAALAWALNKLGESVLVIDFCSSNQLAMHFNAPGDLARGWMRAALDNSDWRQTALRYLPGLDVTPFGILNEQELLQLDQDGEAPLTAWLAHLPELQKHYRWLLLDVPAQQQRWSRQITDAADHLICLITADANSQLRLHQRRFSDHTRFLLNQFNANSQSQQDLQLLWLSTLAQLIPVNIHRDEAVAEALLLKQPTGEYRPESLAVDEIATLASWLLLNLAEKRA